MLAFRPHAATRALLAGAASGAGYLAGSWAAAALGLSQPARLAIAAAVITAGMAATFTLSRRRPRRQLTVPTRFLALRACWTILRGGSVAWNLNVISDGFESRTPPVFVSGCTLHGRPVTLEHVWHADPGGQP